MKAQYSRPNPEMEAMAAAAGLSFDSYADEGVLAWMKKLWPSAFQSQLSTEFQVTMETLRPFQVDSALLSMHPTALHCFMFYCPFENEDEEHREELWRAIAGSSSPVMHFLWNCSPPSSDPLDQKWQMHKAAAMCSGHAVDIAPICYKTNTGMQMYAPWIKNADLPQSLLLFQMLHYRAPSSTLLLLGHAGCHAMDFALFLAIGRCINQRKWCGSVHVFVPRLQPTPCISLGELWRACSADATACRIWKNPAAFMALLGVTAQNSAKRVGGTTLWEWVQGLGTHDKPPTLRDIEREIEQWPSALRHCVRSVIWHLVGNNAPSIIDPYKYAILRIVVTLPRSKLHKLPPETTPANIWAAYSGHYAKTYYAYNTPTPLPLAAVHCSQPDPQAMPIRGPDELLMLLRQEAHHIGWYLQCETGAEYSPCTVVPNKDPEQGQLSLWGWPHSADLAPYPVSTHCGAWRFLKSQFWTEAFVTSVL